MQHAMGACVVRAIRYRVAAHNLAVAACLLLLLLFDAETCLSFFPSPLSLSLSLSPSSILSITYFVSLLSFLHCSRSAFCVIQNTKAKSASFSSVVASIQKGEEIQSRALPPSVVFSMLSIAFRFPSCLPIITPRTSEAGRQRERQGRGRERRLKERRRRWKERERRADVR